MEEKSLAVSNSSLFEFKDINQAFKFCDMLSKSPIIPDAFRNNAASCLIAVEMASRMNRNPLEVMQSMYIVHGKPSFSASFLISLVNSCGLFERLKFEFVGKQGSENFGCYAWTVEKSTGEKLTGPVITLKMARDEGWARQNKSKWDNMPEVMLRYRAASFFTRLFCPDLISGFAPDDVDAETPEIKVKEPEQAQEQESVSNKVIEAEVLEDAEKPENSDKSDAVKKEKSENNKDELMRQEILKLVKALELSDEDAAEFFENYGDNSDLNKIFGENLISVGKAARALLDEQQGVNKQV